MLEQLVYYIFINWMMVKSILEPNLLNSSTILSNQDMKEDYMIIQFQENQQLTWMPSHFQEEMEVLCFM